MQNFFVDLNIGLYHNLLRESRFNSLAAHFPGNILDGVDFIGHFLDVCNEKAVDSILDDFRHRAFVEGEDGSAAGHRFDDAEAERFAEINRV